LTVTTLARNFSIVSAFLCFFFPFFLPLQGVCGRGEFLVGPGFAMELVVGPIEALMVGLAAALETESDVERAAESVAELTVGLPPGSGDALTTDIRLA
jgi:hypothetical protein